MHIALTCPYSLSRPGGVQGQVVGLARALRSRGHEVVVLAPIDEPFDRGGLGLPSDAFISLGRSLRVPANGSVAPVSLSVLAARRALRSLPEAGVEVVHLHEPLAPVVGYACMFGCRLAKVATFHRSGSSLAYRLSGLSARALARRLDARCAVSPSAAATAATVLGGKFEIVGNGVEFERFENARPWPTAGPTVLFVGRHEARKGLSVLLSAWETLGGRCGDAVLWVAGEGPETQALRRRYPGGGHLEWLGRIDDDELASRLAGAHVMCAPSLGGESFGVVLVEAMAARTAVVASDIPGYAFVVGSHGRLVAPGDVRLLAEALRDGIEGAVSSTGLSAPEALDRASEAARGWSMSAVAGRYLSIYRGLLS